LLQTRGQTRGPGSIPVPQGNQQASFQHRFQSIRTGLLGFQNLDQALISFGCPITEDVPYLGQPGQNRDICGKGAGRPFDRPPHLRDPVALLQEIDLELVKFHRAGGDLQPLVCRGQSSIDLAQIHLEASQPQIGARQSRVGIQGLAVEVERLVIQPFLFTKVGKAHLEPRSFGDLPAGLLQHLPGLVLPIPLQMDSGQSKVPLSQFRPELDGSAEGLESLLGPAGLLKQTAPTGVEVGSLRKALQGGTDLLQPPVNLSPCLTDPDEFRQYGRSTRLGVHGPPVGLLALLPLFKVEVEVSNFSEDGSVARH